MSRTCPAQSPGSRYKSSFLRSSVRTLSNRAQPALAAQLLTPRSADRLMPRRRLRHGLLAHTSAQLVSEFSQKAHPGLDVGVCLDPLRLHTVYNSQNPPSLVRLGHDHVDRIRCRTEYSTYFRDILDCIENIHRKTPV